MDKRKKYFCVVAMVLILLSGYGKISDSAFRMRVTRMIAGEGMFRLVAAQYRQKVAEPVAETASDRSEKEDRPRVALTFDDGPHATYTPLLLDGLRKRGIHATFFLMGKNIRGNEEIVTQMQRDGHLIGNHTYDHVQLDKLPGDQACQQIIKTNNEIYEITGEYPMYPSPALRCLAEGSGALCDHAAGILGCGYPGLEIKKCPFCGKYRKKTSEGWLHYPDA